MTATTAFNPLKGRYLEKANLLSLNSKLRKNLDYGYLPGGLALSPHDSSGHNVCNWATAGCIGGCVLRYAGRQVTRGVRAAADRRTRLLFSDPGEFYRQLDADLRMLARKANEAGLTALCRLNVGSDLGWFHIVRKHPAMQFCDYTKSLKRCMLSLDMPNYELVYSWNEHSHQQTRDVALWLRRGGNVVVVFDSLWMPQQARYGVLPESFQLCRGGKPWPVVDGDPHDIRLRSVDGSGVIIGLRLKGGTRSKQIARETGFAVPLPRHLRGITVEGIGL